MMSEKGQKDHEINSVKLGFTDKKITSYGGFSMLAMFFKKVELKAALNQFIPIQETSPNAMKAEEKILGFMTTVIAGGRRFSHLLYLGNFEVIKSVFGLRRFQ